MLADGSRARVLAEVTAPVSEQFPFIGTLVRDQIVSTGELHLMESLVLGRKSASLAEQQVLDMIFRHAERWEYPEPVKADMARFRRSYGVYSNHGL